MGKRSTNEKPSSTNISPPDKSASEITDQAIIESEEPYTLTNNFTQDFRELAKRAGFPELEVVPRPQCPSTNTSVRLDSAPTPGRSDKKDDKRLEDNTRRGDVTPSSMDTGSGEVPPTTYVVKEKFDYFKPNVQVMWDEEGNKTMIKELYIRGWRIDSRIMDIFNLTLPQQEKLTKIDFWNTGLTDSLLDVLAGVLKQLPSVKTLCLDGNPVILQNYGVFLGEESALQHLSLRNCYVNELGANHIGRALSTNKNLLTLNLCYNKISCEGATLIAKGLRINRTLLCLDLGSNLIGDVGAAKLAETISKFALNHDETVARRLLLSKKNVEEVIFEYIPVTLDVQTPTHKGNTKTDFRVPPVPQVRAVNQGTLKSDRPPSVRSGSHLSKDRKEKQKGAKKDGKKVEEKPIKKASSTDAAKDAKKGKKGSVAKADKKGSTGIVDQEVTDVVEFPNPLLEQVQEIRGELFIPGNRALINLNLCRNKISEIGMKSLLNAIQYQSQLSVLSTRTIGIGLMRLSIQRNSVPEDNTVYQNVLELMVSRDPYFKQMENFSREDITPIKELE